MSTPALRRVVTGYALGVLLSAAALAVVLGAGPLLDRAPELPFILGVLITAWRGGRGPGLLAAAASTACLAYLFAPLGQAPADLARLALFAGVSSLVAWFTARRDDGAQRLPALARVAPVGLFRADASGQYLYVNEHWCRLVGLSLDDARGWGWTAALHPEEGERVANAWAAAISQGREFKGEFRLADRGTTRWVECYARPERISAGRIISYIGTLTDITERRRAEEERVTTLSREQVARSRAEASIATLQLLYQMTDAVARETAVEEVYDIALRSLTWAVGAHRAAVLLFDEDGVLRFKAWHGLSDAYRAAVEGHSPWSPTTTDPQPIIVPDVSADPSLDSLRPALQAEGIQALAFIPLLGHGRLLGKFMVYFGTVAALDQEGLQIAQTVARHVAFTIERKRDDEARAALLRREQQARREAETANRAKDEFLAVLSHELRSPLNAIIGWLSILRRSPQDPRMAERAFEVIDRNARVQVSLIDDLLDVSRIVSGRFKIEPAPVDLVVVATEAVETFATEATGKGVRLRTTVKASLLPVLGDRVRLHQIVANLVANSVKFTPAGGQIEVRIEQANDKARVVVEDNGEGIDPEVLPHVFERFMQADSTTMRRHGGLGLGLTLVRHLVEAHHGQVEAESAGKGKGTKITVDLPLTTAPLPRRSRPAVSTGRPSAPVLAGTRVIVVEDDPDSRQYMEVVLAQAGADVRATASGEQALDILKQEPVDILVADIGMPGLDGHALVQRLRELEVAQRRPETPAVAVSAYAGAEDRHRAMASGYHGHVAKPVEPATLVRAVAAALGRTEPARPA
jgi:PAS domain S-box-containing protein